MKEYFVYIVTNQTKTVHYIGITNDLSKRLDQHFFVSKNSRSSFAGKYNCYHLLFYEAFGDPQVAITREKEIKKWRREKKEYLISKFNPEWIFLEHSI